MRIATALLALPLRHSSLSLSPVERGGGHVQGRRTLDLEHFPGDHLELFHAVQGRRDGGALCDVPAAEKAGRSQ